MIRRALVLFALFTLALMSAASAHEHGSHAMPAVVASATLPVTLPDTMPILDHASVQLTAAADPSCLVGSTTGHSHKPADCVCPAACAGLFDVVVAAMPAPAVALTVPPSAVRHLLSVADAPPTPPPRA